MEIWRQVNDLDYDNYEVSNLGNVKNSVTGNILRQGISVGYYSVRLSQNNIKKSFKVHLLVGRAFLENPDNKPNIDHIDNNRLNNNILNLRYCTKQENIRNSKMNTKNTSGVKGVSFVQSRNKWIATIKIDGILINLRYVRACKRSTHS